MVIEYYLCPYDIEIRGSLHRTPAMYRYIPVIPNPDGFKWSEIEIIGNHCMVKVDCSESMHLQMQADVDFMILPEVFTIPEMDRLKGKLGLIGYEPVEIQSVTNLRTLLDMLVTGGRKIVKANGTKTDIEIVPGRVLLGKTLEIQDGDIV